MGINKVVFGNDTLIDISDSTITAADLRSGVVAYNAAGERIVGTADMQGGDRVYYAVCNTASATQIKEVTINGITSLYEGLSLRIKFANYQNYDGQPQLKLNNLSAINICRYGTYAADRYEWRNGEVVDFVYDGANWLMVDAGTASRNYWGITKLSSETDSTLENIAATPAAVKAVADRIGN